jgi:RND family efflux transporter MFP subunit
MRRRKVLVRYVTVAGLVLSISGCKKPNQYAPPPPPKVSVSKPVTRNISRYLEATGNIGAVASVDLVARVEGIVQTISYTDGAQVKAGDILFTIEPQPYQARLQKAQAAETAAQAQLVSTQATLSRQESLQRQAVSSSQSLDDTRSQRDAAQANLAQAQANTQLASITSGYTRILAPFDGKVSAHLVSVGGLVGTSPTKLATIVQMQPMQVSFTVSEQDVQRIRAKAIQSGRTGEAIEQIPVEVGLQGEAGYPHRGHLDYVAPTVDPATGTLAARGALDNVDGILVPGYFARVRIPLVTDTPALLVPDAALVEDQGGQYVLVVGADNVVQQKRVTVGPAEGVLRVIEAGLIASDQVIVDGLQRALPGQTVEPATVSVAANVPNDLREVRR